MRPGFDIETLLGERALSYALLTAIDAGTIPTLIHADNPELDIWLLVTDPIDRLYQPHPDATIPGIGLGSFDVELLFGHATGADLRLKIQFDISHLPSNTNFEGVTADLLFTMALDVVPDGEGGLETALFRVELVDVESFALAVAETQFGITKASVLETLKPIVDRQFDATGIGAFQRVGNLGLRKHEGDDEHPAAVGLYLNLRLRGPDGPCQSKSA